MSFRDEVENATLVELDKINKTMRLLTTWIPLVQWRYEAGYNTEEAKADLTISGKLTVIIPAQIGLKREEQVLEWSRYIFPADHPTAEDLARAIHLDAAVALAKQLFPTIVPAMRQGVSHDATSDRTH